MKKRLDQLLVDRGLAESRQKAQALILAGNVLVAGQKGAKAGQMTDEAAPLQVLERMPFVSRGGFKLQGALDAFGIDPTGWTCVDIGSSTGGFTDCLLQRGAAKVYAIDVGHGQLDWQLRNNPRVVAKEGINARHLRPEDVGEPCDLAVCDVSFISVTLIVPVIPALLKESGQMVILVKPQFEAGREQVGKGGIVRDPDVHTQVCAKVESAVRGLGFATRLIESPISGAGGNREFLLHGQRQ